MREGRRDPPALGARGGWTSPSLRAAREEVQRALADLALCDLVRVHEQLHADRALAAVVAVGHDAADLAAVAEADGHDLEALRRRHDGRRLLAARELDVLADDAVVLRQ